jgi:para-nitrobenzyl esterase
MSGSGAASSVGDMSLEQAEALGLEFQKIAGCSSLAELRELSSEEVFQAMKLMGGKERGFSTIRDGYMVKEPFSELVRYGKIHDISYMVGCCSHEGAAFGDGYKQSAAGVNGLINRMFRGHADAVKPLYNVNTDEDAKNCERDLITDGSVYGVNLWGRLQVKNKKKPAYLYLFDRTIPDKDGNPSWEAAFHSGDLWYVHGTIDRSWRGMNEDDRKVSNLMMDYWTNFARSGDPNGEGLPRWTPFTFEERNTMVLNENASMSSLAEYPPIKVLETWK